MLINCPFCSYDLEIDVKFAKKNGRVFCGTCCKSFEIELTNDLPEKEDSENALDDDFFNDYPMD